MRLPIVRQWLQPSLRDLVLCGLGFWVANAGLACPIKPPEGTQGVAVGEELVVNGLPVSVLNVVSRMKPGELLSRTQEAWKEGGYDTRRHVVGEWQVVSAASPTCVTTLQLTERNGSFGYLAVSTPDRQRAPIGPELQAILPKGLNVESAVETRDQGRAGFTVIMTSSIDSEQLRDAFIGALQKRNWEAIGAHRIRRPGDKLDAEKITAQRDRQQLSVLIWRDLKPQVVLNLSEAL